MPRSPAFCSPVEIKGRVNVGRGYKGGSNDFSGVMFLPGVTHKFVGSVCLFDVATSVTVLGGVSGHVEYGDNEDVFSGGTVVGPSTIQLTVNFGKLDDSAKSKLFQIQSDASDPLVLKVTPAGYEYVSGTGTLQAPAGKKYTFGK